MIDCFLEGCSPVTCLYPGDSNNLNFVQDLHYLKDLRKLSLHDLRHPMIRPSPLLIPLVLTLDADDVQYQVWLVLELALGQVSELYLSNFLESNFYTW